MRSADYRQMRWLAPVAVLVGLLVMLAIRGLSESLPIGALAIFSAGVLSGRLASRNHVWMAAAGACVAAVLGLIAMNTAAERTITAHSAGVARRRRRSCWW